eukprot:XP_001703308.1 TFIIH 34kDa subunit [Chlamydomonas reinhardtii]
MLSSHNRLAVFAGQHDFSARRRRRQEARAQGLQPMLARAQRAQVVLDAVVVAPQDSSFMQQAAHLTGGLYFRPHRGRGLLGVLLNHFVCDTATRKQLDEAQALGVDFRASCFCHKYVIETGYVCSVCLSIFCQPSRSCTTRSCNGEAFLARPPSVHVRPLILQPAARNP